MNLKDNDYTLVDGAAWFEVKGFAIRIHSTDEGVVVDVFKNGDYTEAIASTYAFDTEGAAA
jgi:hypothetical protein